jgi:hypothetical protein
VSIVLLRFLLVLSFFIFFASFTWAGGFVEYTGVKGIEKLAPVLRGKLEQELKFVRAKAQQKSFRLIVSLRARESANEFTKSFSTLAGNKFSAGHVQQVQDDVLNTMLEMDSSVFKVLRKYQSLYGFSAEALPEAILRLIENQEVVSVEEMPIYSKMDAEAFSLTSTDLAHLNGWTGKGITIAIIDDAIDYNHPAFDGLSGYPNSKVIGGYDFADFDSDPVNDCPAQNHGTATAGVAVGNGGGITGTAPDANLVFLKIQKAASCGEPWLDGDIIGAIDWVISHRDVFGIKIISLSLGSETTYSSPCSGSVLRNALIAARNAGLIVVAAAGNSSTANGLSDPACHPDVVSVGAVYDADLGYAEFRDCTDIDTRADMVSCYSNSAYFLDILAPGHCATTAQTGGGVTSCFGGTSSSTPYVAGVLATLYEKKILLERNAAVDALVAWGDLITDPRSGLATPRVNQSRSLNSLGGEGSEVTLLTNGVARTNLSDGQEKSKLFAFYVPEGATELKFQTTGGSGDTDLYVRLGIVPTLSIFDCRSNNSGTSERCSFQEPKSGTYYVLMYGHSTYAGVSLQASYTVFGSNVSTTVLTNGVSVTGLTGAEMSNRYYSLAVPAGSSNLKFQISGGSGDADLHVQYGTVPTEFTFDCRPFTLGNTEVCITLSPKAGMYYVMIHAYRSYSGLTLRCSYDNDLAGKGQKVVAPLFLLWK